MVRFFWVAKDRLIVKNANPALNSAVIEKSLLGQSF
jgi:hypothetical protein